MKTRLLLLAFFTLVMAFIVRAQSSSNEKNEEASIEFSVNDVTFKMISVEGGTYTMGSDEDITLLVGPAPIIWNYDYEKPAHKVTVSSFYIGQTEVTQELWEAVMGKNPSSIKGSKRPVDKVSWNDCQKFIKKLNKLTGKKFRLPSEEEWEYAARGGNKSKGYKYSGSDNIDAVAWYQLNCNPDYGTHPVATKLANELGIYDMSGNVREWCQNKWYKYDGSSCNSSYRGCRDGDFSIDSWCCRVFCRSGESPSYRTSGIGLRLAM
jgi:formylglycine-generating enzyme required for sulfatase activity